MTKESLIKARDLILAVLDTADIEVIDKLELMLNTSKFLTPEEYEQNIMILQRSKEWIAKCG